MDPRPDIPRDDRTPRPGSSPHAPAWAKGWLGELQPPVAVAIVVIVSLLSLVALGIGIDLLVTGDRVHPGVKVGGVDVGGLTTDEAEQRLTDSFVDSQARPVKVVHLEREWSVIASELDARLDSRSSAARAWRVGRSGVWWRDGVARLGAWMRLANVPARVVGDEQKTDQVVRKITGTIEVPARDATATVQASTAKLVSSAPGVAVLRGSLRAAILTAMASSEREVVVETAEWPVRVRDDDAQAALVQANAIMEAPASVVYGKRRWPVTRERLARWVGFRQVPVDDGASGATTAPAVVPPMPDEPSRDDVRLRLEAYLAADRVRADLAPLTKGIGRPSQDARIVAEEGRVRIVQGETGIGPDFSGLAQSLRDTLVADDSARSAVLRLTELPPKVSTEKIMAMGIKERIGKFTTTYSPWARKRVNNIHTLAKAIDETYLKPGDVFSFNGKVGQRTAEKGYKEAPAIVNGKLEPQLGGGICQVGTTFYNAVFFSGLPILERKNHSFYISHYPLGRDCTVSWKYPDFKFRNDTDDWVLIRTSVTRGSLTVSLYGTDPGYKVEYTTSEFTDIKPHGKETVKDANLEEGKKVIDDPGIDGGTVTVVRTVRKGDKVVREDTFVSHYKPKDEVVRVGTKKVSKPATSTP